MIPLFQVATNVEAALKNIEDALRSGYVGQGPWCEKLERQIKNECGSEHALYVNSGTSALKLAYKLAGVGPWTEVISTPITCIATNSAILELGARIVWADVDARTGNLSVEDAVRKVTPSTRAIVGVNWGGRQCNFTKLRELTRGITLIEDAAHCVMEPEGKGGDYVAYSMQAIKYLHSADGGVLVCPTAATYERAKLLRWFGLDRTRSDSMRCYQPIDETGFKMQGNDVLAALACANLDGLDDRQKRQRDNAEAIWKALENVPNLLLPPHDHGCHYWLFTILVSSPPRFEEFARKRGVMVSQVHARNDLYGCFRAFFDPNLPGVDYFAAHQVSIPCGWWLDEGQCAQVVQTVQEWSKQPEARWSME